ncbi:hypothetical protein PINS_up008088 [Pythium insidiosum]|nr:hypothetical protein PINS_up008088 [Pythium insidiosum]
MSSSCPKRADVLLRDDRKSSLSNCNMAMVGLRTASLLRALTLAALALSHAICVVMGSASTLRQVAVLSRHGVRGPYGFGTRSPTPEQISTFVRNPKIQLPLAARDWGTSDDPNEIVSPKLTQHGYRLVELMGEYFRNHLYRDFLAETSCKRAFAYADANQRDNLTAQAFVDGAFPSCADLVPITKGTRLLFEQGQDPTATCPVCSRTLYEGMVGAPDCRYVVAENRREIEELNTLLDCCAPVACALNSSDTTAMSNDTQCTFFDVPAQWRGDFYSPWKDALASADYMAEFLTLLALNNMTIPAPFTFEKILELSRIHAAHIDLVTNEVNSENFGGTFLAHLAASFEQTMTGKALPLPSGKPGPKLAQSLDNRFLYYAGHDINLLYVRNLLRLEWYSDGWHPHEPTPGSMLVFRATLERGSLATRQQRKRKS